ncbi:hypothetical protein DNTS_023983 [Danionella cerebrum]|uniref:Beta-alanine-activating enzyme n=1 Tax=Danionella cerebrum TaxID=2873325 RepID=A0A553MVA6_9TELE|nr:hypothetical protein DNTS_023983 [Danionella translucida]
MTAKSLHELVHEAALEHGDKTAVVFDSSISARISITYNEIISLSDQLTRELRVSVQTHNTAIGLFCHPDILLPVWIISILQVPLAYVPLDPASPPLCSRRMMSKCKLSFCLIQNELLHQFQQQFSSLISVKMCSTLSSHRLTLIRIEGELESKLPGAAILEDVQQREPLAYVLHTSGTTGVPKIVKVPHKCIVPNIICLRSVFMMTPEDVVFLSSPLTFDPSVVEMFLALSSGACLLIVPPAVKKMPRRLSQVLFKRNNTTVLQATPTLVRRFGRRVLQEEVLSSHSSLRLLAFGGEPCPSLKLIRGWKQEGNRTSICNLYGTTEVSCWASCYKVPEEHLCSVNVSDVSLPLGQPMLDTVMEVRDEKGRLVTEGEGQLFIGGRERVCLLDDEESLVQGTMRATGDWVQVRDPHLYFLGRKDRLVKRFGQRVHLDALQQVIESLPEVEACAVNLSEGDRLVAFIVLSSSRPGEHPTSSSTFLPEIHSHHPEEYSQSGSTNSPDLKHIDGNIRHELSQKLPNHSIPDMILFIPALPLTSHGKVDSDELMKIFGSHGQDKKEQTLQKDFESVKIKLENVWKECLGLQNDAEVKEDAHFMLSGGDSLQALRLFDEITISMGTASVGLLEVILDGSFSDLLSHIMGGTQDSILPKKRALQCDDTVVPSKQPKEGNIESTTGFANPSDRVLEFLVIGRAGEVFHCGVLKFQGQSKQSNFNPPLEMNKTPPRISTIENNPERPLAQEQRLREYTSDVLPIGLHVLWSSDTGRCVDASPVLLVLPDRTTVFIGSHSHRMQALDLASGEVVWERVLGDRLESSAAISKCGTFVVVGCYDGLIYFLDVFTGETMWTFKTGDVVKSSPTVDSKTGLVFAGSYDGCIYALDPLGKACVWQHYCGGSAVFSSPCMCLSPRQLYCSTLGGNLHCFNPDSGKVLWTYSSSAPFFSSPRCSETSVFIGSVNGHIIGLSHSGETLWDYTTKEPVFSSPCIPMIDILTNQQASLVFSGCSSTLANATVTCGSHDGHVYCLNGQTGSLLWRFQTTGKVFSTPFVFAGSSWGVRSLVAVCSTDGKIWILDGENGTLKGTLSLPGELFSSPVVWENKLVVGCRNDYVYCLELTKLL